MLKKSIWAFVLLFTYCSLECSCKSKQFKQHTTKCPDVCLVVISERSRWLCEYFSNKVYRYFKSDLYKGWSKSLFLFLIQRKVRILSKFCDVHIEIKYIRSKWFLFEKQLWRHSLWHVTSRDIPKGVIVVNPFSCVTSAKFEIFFHSKKHSIPLRNVHLKLIATDPKTPYSCRINYWNIYIFSIFFNFKIVLHISLCY